MIKEYKQNTFTRTYIVTYLYILFKLPLEIASKETLIIIN